MNIEDVKPLITKVVSIQRKFSPRKLVRLADLSGLTAEKKRVYYTAFFNLLAEVLNRQYVAPNAALV